MNRYFFLAIWTLLGCDRISIKCMPSSETTRAFETCVRNVAKHSKTGDGDIEDVASDCASAAKRVTACRYVAGVVVGGRWTPCSEVCEPEDLQLCAPYLRKREDQQLKPTSDAGFQGSDFSKRTDRIDEGHHSPQEVSGSTRSHLRGD